MVTLGLAVTLACSPSKTEVRPTSSSTIQPTATPTSTPAPTPPLSLTEGPSLRPTSPPGRTPTPKPTFSPTKGASPRPTPTPAPTLTPKASPAPTSTAGARLTPRATSTTEIFGSSQLPDDPRGLMAGALKQTFTGDDAAVRKMGHSGNASYIPVLIEFLRYPWLLNQKTADGVLSSLADLIGQSYEQLAPEQLEWDWWVVWLNDHPEVQTPDGYAAWKGGLLSKGQSLSLRPRYSGPDSKTVTDNKVGDFLYDGVKTRIRLEEIVWGGVAKDGIPDLINPPVLSATEATYLHPSDRVFGVSINGEHRAYPLRILNAHEMANDVVGGVSIALAY